MKTLAEIVARLRPTSPVLRAIQETLLEEEPSAWESWNTEYRNSREERYRRNKEWLRDE